MSGDESGATAEEVASFFRQRMEMGGDEVFLDRMTREEVLSILSHSVRFSVAGIPCLLYTSPSPRDRG